MYPAINCHAANTATEPNAELLARCEHALELLLTHRGNPSVEIDRVLADDPQCVFGHCLRAASIVRADAAAARSTLAASVAVIEAACPDIDDPARRHAAAARAWLEGDSALAARALWRHRHRLAARHSRARGRACTRLPPRPAAHDARSYRPGAAGMGRRDARLRERPCDVRVRPGGERPVSSCRKDGASRARPRPPTSRRHSRRRYM